MGTGYGGGSGGMGGNGGYGGSKRGGNGGMGGKGGNGGKGGTHAQPSTWQAKGGAAVAHVATGASAGSGERHGRFPDNDHVEDGPEDCVVDMDAFL